MTLMTVVRFTALGPAGGPLVGRPGGPRGRSVHPRGRGGGRGQPPSRRATHGYCSILFALNVNRCICVI